ncbi:MAG TPA: glycosyltransferase family 4 protein [Acidimicrobiales bacterium]|nr:glycosyltransferase family 4 protein [Acidimicrobiales bacterium]
MKSNPRLTPGSDRLSGYLWQMLVRLRAASRRRHPGFAARERELNALGVAIASSPGPHPRRRPVVVAGRLLAGAGRRRASRSLPAGRPRSVLMVVQRYGPEVAGGAEALCRQLAVRLAGRGLDVHVLTSCATDAETWANAYPEGSSTVDGVTVHRLAVRKPRDPVAFGSLCQSVLPRGAEPGPELQKEWLEAQGPDLPDLVPWLEGRVDSFDLAMHFSYLYSTTWGALPVTSGRIPTVLHATAHDEAAFWLPAYDPVFRMPSAFAWLTAEERDLVLRRGGRARGMVVGAGFDLAGGGRGEAFRRHLGLGDSRYLLFVGRAEDGKGARELTDFFQEYKARHPGPLQLVFVGPAAERVDHPAIHYAGFVEERLRGDAMAGCLALVQPSYFESFSMVLVEAWSEGRPVLVQGLSDVLAGQARRSGGGVSFRGYAEFEAAVELLERHPRVAGHMGRAGRRFSERNFGWDVVLDRYEGLMAVATATPVRPVSTTPRG